MAFAQASNTRLAYIAETTFGTTPSTPTLKALRRTGGTFEPRIGEVISGQVSSVRDVRAAPQVAHDVVGSVQCEWSHQTLDDLLEAVMGGTWATNVLKTGATTRWFTFEETIPVGATNNYHRYEGCSVNTLDIALSARSIFTGGFSLMGKKMATPATSIISGATYTAENTEPIFTGDKAASLSVLGGSVSLRSLSLNINNNLRIRPVVGSLYSEEYGLGQIDITGRAEGYFTDNTLINAVIGHSSGAITFTIGVDTNEKYTINVPAAQIGNGRVTGGSRDDDKMIEFDFRAVYSASDSSSLVITRVVA